MQQNSHCLQSKQKHLHTFVSVITCVFLVLTFDWLSIMLSFSKILNLLQWYGNRLYCEYVLPLLNKSVILLSTCNRVAIPGSQILPCKFILYKFIVYVYLQYYLIISIGSSVSATDVLKMFLKLTTNQTLIVNTMQGVRGTELCRYFCFNLTVTNIQHC